MHTVIAYTKELRLLHGLWSGANQMLFPMLNPRVRFRTAEIRDDSDEGNMRYRADEIVIHPRNAGDDCIKPAVAKVSPDSGKKHGAVKANQLYCKTVVRLNEPAETMNQTEIVNQFTGIVESTENPVHRNHRDAVPVITQERGERPGGYPVPGAADGG